MPRPVGFARWRSELPSGGNRYDEELSTGLRALGHDVRERAVTGTWPVPTARDRERFAAKLHAERDWLVGNIVASAAPEPIADAVNGGTRVTMLMHYFPADDVLLPSADRTRLAASEAAAVAAASRVVVTSAWAAAEVRSRYGRRDVVVATPGVERAELAAGSMRRAQPPALLWLGRLTTGKDPLTLIEALHEIRDLRWTAQLVGPDIVEPRLTDAVRERLARYDLSDDVAVTGPREGAALEATWSGTDLLVHTSRAETYGMVISEALARGIPSIVPSGTGAISAQGAGATFQPGDSRALAALLRSWLTGPQLQVQWRAAAIDRRAHLPTWLDTARIVSAALER